MNQRSNYKPLEFTFRHARPLEYPPHLWFLRVDRFPRSLFRLIAAGLPEIRFNDLRHTAASLMLNHGVPVIVVSRQMGHARPAITLDIYGHLIPGMQEEAAKMIDDLIAPVEFQQLHPICTQLHLICTLIRLPKSRTAISSPN